MEFNPSDIQKLAAILKVEGEDSSSDDDLPNPSSLGPGDIKTKCKVRINVPQEEYEHYERSQKKSDPKVIWNIEEVNSVPYCDDASYDPRQCPTFDIKYRQAVTSEDVFLQLGQKTPSTASCETMVIELQLDGEKKEDVDLNVTATLLDLRSPLYRLSLPLPHPADPGSSSAEWDPVRSILTISLALTRELDFVNF